MFADVLPQWGQTRWKHPVPSRTASGLTPQHFPTIKSAISHAPLRQIRPVRPQSPHFRPVRPRSPHFRQTQPRRPRIPAGSAAIPAFSPGSATLPRIPAVRYVRVLCPRPARGIYIPCPASLSRPEKNFRRVCAMRGAGLCLADFRGIGRGRGPAPPVEAQRRELPADPIMHRIMARFTKPDQVPTAIAILWKILHRPSVMRHSGRCSPAVSCAVLAGTAP